MRVKIWMIKHWMTRAWEEMLMKIVWMLPKKIVMWSFVRVTAHATTGKWSKQIVPELTAMDALKRWEDKSKEPATT